MTRPVLEVRDLVTEFSTQRGVVRAVDGVSFSLAPGEALGIVGESGSGKTVTVMSAMRLVKQPPGRIVSGEVLLDGTDLLALSDRELRRVRGNDIAMVFQDPMTSLNPVLTVGRQLDETRRAHGGERSRARVREHSVELLAQVGVANPELRHREYPMHYSGGMRQRAVLAMALTNRPRVLLADEPTTALDATIQAQILDLLRRVRETQEIALVLITHDLRLIAEMADRVIVMYGGRVVEQGTVEEVLTTPHHPYTIGLLRSMPELGGDRREQLAAIAGEPFDPFAPPSGCVFRPRCPLAQERCAQERPALRQLAAGGERLAACHFAEQAPALMEART